MRRNHDFHKVHVEKDDGTTKVVLELDPMRFEMQYSRAQFELDSMIMTDMIPYMPMITGSFINVTKAMSAAIAGTGWVYAAAPPYGRFLYYGKTMVSPSTGSTWAKYGEEKVLVSKYGGKTRAKENLQYTKTFHPKVVAKWYDAAKRAHGDKWVMKTKATAGGGRNG